MNGIYFKANTGVEYAYETEDLSSVPRSDWGATLDLWLEGWLKEVGASKGYWELW